MPSPDGPLDGDNPHDLDSGHADVPLPSGTGASGGRAAPPRESPSFLRDLWPVVLLLAISAATLIVAAGGPRPAAGPAATPEDKVAPAAPGEADGRPDEQPDKEVPEEPAGPVETALETAARAFLGLGVLCLVMLVDPRARRWLLPPPRTASRATWGTEQLLYGFLLAFATLVLVSAGARFIPEDSSLVGPLMQAAGQLAIAATVVALVLTRPSAFPHVFGPAVGPARGAGLSQAGPAPTASMYERLASLGISGRDAGANSLRGAVAVVAAFPLAVGAGLLGRAVHAWVTGEEPGLHPVIERVAAADTLEVATLVAVACVAAPLFEELFFRGFLYPSIRDRFGVAGGAVASSLIFASVHPGLPNQMATFVLGVVFCLVYERAGTLVAPVVAHALFNAIELAFVIALRAAG
ncbi:MAG: lysostaphin resistance A-like protein [Planctomycetota bacterium]